MKYERITNSSLAKSLNDIEYKNLGDKYYIRLAELEDKIENGTLMELPCKVGDTVWYVIQRGKYSTLCSTTVSRICIDSPNRMVIYLNATVRKIYIGYAQDDNAFLTKIEAEKRLEELKGQYDRYEKLLLHMGESEEKK